MKKLNILLMLAVIGYIFHPSLAPHLLKLAGLPPLPVEEEESELTNQDEPIEQTIEKPLEKKPIIKIPELIAEKNVPKVPVAPMPNKIPKVDPVIPDKEPEIVLSAADFERIITASVEAGNHIPFKEDNIIEWALKEQSIHKIEDRYEGEVSIEIGDLFGKHIRRVFLSISDEKITTWDWITDEEEK